jgi:hypothetical protein
MFAFSLIMFKLFKDEADYVVNIISFILMFVFIGQGISVIKKLEIN